MSRHSSIAVRATVLLLTVLAVGCGHGMPRRVAGSDITLPRSRTDEILQALVPVCDVRADSARAAAGTGRSACTQLSDTLRERGRVTENVARTP
jgi:hypothetical protein